MRWAWVGWIALTGCGQGFGGPKVADYAEGVVIRKVAIMQGVDNVLYRQNRNSPRTVPVVAQRDGLLRIYLNLVEDFEPRPLVGTLTLYASDGEPIETLTESKWVTDVSVAGDLDTTFNFRLDGSQIRQGTEFAFELREADLERASSGRAEEATFRSADQRRSFDPQPSDTLTIVIVPIAYNADGSGRVPDTGPEQIEQIRQAVYALYPASEVVIEVEEARQWNAPVSATNGQEWSNLLVAVSNYAAGADVPPNTYFYGLFDPAPSANVYCQQGCTLGLSTLAVRPTDFARASIGLGFPGLAASTLVHEVGHAHGRPHAPCGRPGNVDADYPYDGAEIGVWGYSLNVDELRPPDLRDMMSYCNPIWVSDYNFALLHDRIVELRDRPRSQPYLVSRLFLDEEGGITPGAPVSVREPVVGSESIAVDIFTEDGTFLKTLQGAFFPYDHFDGGSIVLDEVLGSGLTVKVRR